MFITTHAAIATIAGTQIANPIFAFIAGVILHFAFDIIPHGDSNLGKSWFGFQLRKFREAERLRAILMYGTLDSCALVLYLLFIFRTFDFARSDNVTWAILGGILPDILVVIYQFFKLKPLKGFYKLHNKIHFILTSEIHNDIPMRYSFLLQGIAVALIISLMYFI